MIAGLHYRTETAGLCVVGPLGPAGSENMGARGRGV